MRFLAPFDPWHSSMCTCPPKLTLNPYTGCTHSCVYCYASSYIPHFTECRPKKSLVHGLEKEALRLHGEIVSMSNSSDPYPPVENEMLITRRCLEILSRSDCSIQIITKSPLVLRDIDILQKAPSTVALTVTTDNEAIALLLEPRAPPPSLRLKAAETLVNKGVPVSVRLDPIIPFVNDNPASLVKTLGELGVRHLTSSTYKVRPDNWRRFASSFPEIANRLKPLYFSHGEKTGGYILLPRDLRLKLMQQIRGLAIENGMSFGVCRENLSWLNTASCDGSWLIPQKALTRGSVKS